MRNLAKYLKPFIFTIILVIGFTFIQVQMELSLPDYMSDIVTNGIQFAGIKDNELKAVSKKTLDKLLLFVDDASKDEILDAYYLVDKTKDIKIYNQLLHFNDDIYLLKADMNDNLKNLMLKPIFYANMLDDESLIRVQNKELEISELKARFDTELLEYGDNLSSASLLLIQKEYASLGLNIEVVQSNYILSKGLMMLMISLIGVLAQIMSTFLATKVATNVSYNLRNDLFKKVESFSSVEFSKFETSSLITRTTNDIQQIQMMVQMLLRMCLMAPMMGLTSIFKVMRYPDLLWILFVALFVIILLMLITLLVAMPRFKKIQSLIDRLNSVMREFLNGLLVIRAFNSEKNEEKRFDEANKTLMQTNLFVDRTMATVMPFMSLVMNFVTIAIIYYSSRQIDMNVMGVGEMMAFIQYATHVLMSFMFVAMMWVMIPRSLVSVARVFEVLNTENSILDKANPSPMTKGAEIIFDKVYFKYPKAEEYVLEDISFSARSGETIAFIGSTGSGKSTLVKLLPRLFDVSEGQILLNGIDIRNYSQKDLRDKIAFASQKAILFKGTIAENIAFGKDLSIDDLNEAIDISQSRNIIDEKEKGLDSEIAQGGANVSGGQKQRLSIARAIAKRSDIFIFDDTFSALDYATDRTLRQRLKELIKKKNVLIFIVAQRISTIKDADKIIVLDEGKIVGMGKHDELLKSCKIYKEIATSQLSEKELEDNAA